MHPRLLRAILSVATAVLLDGCSGTAGVAKPGDGHTLDGRLLLVEQGGRFYPRTGGDCFDVDLQSLELRERMELFQNARVRVQGVRQGEGLWSCPKSFALESLRQIQIISAPEAIQRDYFSDQLPESRLTDAESMRDFVTSVMRTIARKDFEAFSRLKFPDPVRDAAVRKSGYAKRRFDFIAGHADQFFGAALRKDAPQIIIRQYEGRTSATACICRRESGCKETDAFDAPTQGSWGDAMFCFRIDAGASGWQILDPIFG